MPRQRPSGKQSKRRGHRQYPTPPACEPRFSAATRASLGLVAHVGFGLAAGGGLVCNGARKANLLGPGIRGSPQRPVTAGRSNRVASPSSRASRVGSATGRANNAVAAIVARIPPAEAVGEMASEFRSQIAAFGRLPPGSEEEIVVGLERNLRRWSLWLTTGVAPQDSDFDPLRRWARERATEGVRLEDLLQACSLGAQLGWRLIRRYARAGESEALVEAAGLLMQYVDRVSAVVADTYLAEREVLVSEDERRTRSLLDRLTTAEPLGSEDLELARWLGVSIEPAYWPFAAVMPGRSARQHAALAARLRQSGWTLTVTEGDRVAGLSSTPPDPTALGGGSEVLLVTGDRVPRSELGAARADVVLLVEHGRQLGLHGHLRSDDHLLEILVARSPHVARRLRAKVFDSLPGGRRDELLHTLKTLLSCRLDRAQACALLHIHRNTLAYRLGRIEEITGLDLTDPRDLACAYLALDVAAPQTPA